MLCIDGRNYTSSAIDAINQITNRASSVLPENIFERWPSPFCCNRYWLNLSSSDLINMCSVAVSIVYSMRAELEINVSENILSGGYRRMEEYYSWYKLISKLNVC